MMKRRSLLIYLSLLVCAVMVVATVTQFSLAYIVSRSNILSNSFRVIYLPPHDISIPVTIQKTMVNLGEQECSPEGFDFQLVNVDTGETAISTTDKQGLAAFDLMFDAEDVGKTHRFSLVELNTGRKHIVYDKTVYHIGVALELNEMHEMTAKLTLDGKPVTQIIAEYVNEYNVSSLIPDTGDHAHPAVWAALMIISGAGIVLLGKKRRFAGERSESK